MKKVLMIFVIVAFIFSIGCADKKQMSTEVKQMEATNRLASEANHQVGMPNIKNFTQKKTLKMIYEKADDPNLICYAYYANEMQGKRGEFIGKCIGYGIPFSSQYTNPYKVVDPDSIPGQRYATGEGTPVQVAQPEPNQLYMPTSSDATWLLLINPKDGKAYATYIEPKIIVSQFPLHDIEETKKK